VEALHGGDLGGHDFGEGCVIYLAVVVEGGRGITMGGCIGVSTACSRVEDSCNVRRLTEGGWRCCGSDC
jgi:hypothetical protein